MKFTLNYFLPFILLGFFSIHTLSTEAQKTKLLTRSGKTKVKEPGDNTKLFIDAKKQLLLGNYEKAERFFKTCLEIDPHDAASMYELSGLYLKLDNLESAINYAKHAVETDPENIWYKKRLIELYKRNGDYDKSAKILDDLIERNPENYEYYYDLAIIYLFNRDYKKAVEIYNQLENKIGIIEDISVQKQKIYLLKSDYPKAILEIENLVKAYPGESKYYAMLAELYLSNNQDKKAIEAYNKILEIDPDNPYINISLSDYYRKNNNSTKAYDYLKIGFANPMLDLETKINILLTYYSVNDIYTDKKDQAFELSELLIQSHPENPKAHSIYADLLYQDGRYLESRESLRKVISLDSSMYMIWQQLLFTEAELQDYTSMGKESKKVIGLFPQQPLPYMFSAIANIQNKKVDQAVIDLETGLRFVVDNELLKAQFYSYLGDSYHEIGNDKEAFIAYDKVLQIDPDNSIALNNYAYYLSLKNQDLEKAAEMSKKAVELDPENGSNQDTYGWVLFKLGEYEEAKKWVKKSIDNHQEDNPEILEHYGDILFKLGQVKEAYKYWVKAKKAGSGSDLLDNKIRDRKLYEE